MSDTKTVHDLTAPSGLTVEHLSLGYTAWRNAIEGGSGDDESAAAFELIGDLIAFNQITVTEREVPECDECEEQATQFWPKLAEPVQMCDSCTHNARRSGWEPGQ